MAVWIAVAALAGTVKVRFPAVESTFSFGYIVYLQVYSNEDGSPRATVARMTLREGCLRQ